MPGILDGGTAARASVFSARERHEAVRPKLEFSRLFAEPRIPRAVLRSQEVRTQRCPEGCSLCGKLNDVLKTVH